MLRQFYKYITPWGIATKQEIFKNRVIAKIANAIYPLYCNKKIILTDKVNENIIVSLTSYPPRISKIFYCINSILRQTVRPYKTILWLAKSQFPNGENDLPRRLLKLKSYGLEIVFCDDIKSYKKIVYTGQQYCNYIIITADDDTLYPEDWIENLINTYNKHKDCVVCYRAHEITFDYKFKICPYNQWNGLSVNKKGPSMKLVPIGVGGILYPSNFFSHVDFDYEIIKKLSPTTDDIWLKMIAAKKKIKTVKVYENSKEWFTISKSQKSSLKKINVDTSNANDVALQKLMDYYKITVKELGGDE